MKTFTFFDQATGEPVNTYQVSCPAGMEYELSALNTPDGCVSVEGDFFEGFMLDAQGAVQPIPAPPTSYHKWDWSKRAYTGPHLEEPRREVSERIKTLRNNLWTGGFQCAGHWFASDEHSRMQYLTNKDTARDQIDEGGSKSDPLLDLATGQQVVWKTRTGELPLTVGLAIDIAKAAKVHEAQVFTTAQKHLQAVEVHEDPLNYDIEAGWPNSPQLQTVEK